MNILLKNAKILHPDSSHHGTRKDVLIKNGKIDTIGKDLKPNKVKKIESKNLCISPGWLDVGTQTGDPGYEHREDLHSVSLAASAGGYTALATYPNNDPVTDSKTEVTYIKGKSEASHIDFYPIAAITKNCQGMEITEMYDMRNAGAIGFSDGRNSVDHAGVLLRALQYVKPFDGVILHKPLDASMSIDGHLHEGVTSTLMGLKGIPSMAETIMIERDISLLKYTESRLHIAHVSTKNGLKLIKAAKKSGLKITTSVPVLNLMFEDKDLATFDSNLKVQPPLRSSVDRKALIKGIIDGTIDFVVSNHEPWDEECKQLEFPYAEFGVVGLESSFAVLNTILRDDISLDQTIQLLAINPRKLFGIDVPEIEAGAKANITIFDPSVKWEFDSRHIKSKSKNTPFVGKSFIGKVLGTVNKGKVSIQ